MTAYEREIMEIAEKLDRRRLDELMVRARKERRDGEDGTRTDNAEDSLEIKKSPRGEGGNGGR